MKQKNYKWNKAPKWVKVMLGAFFLLWDMFKSKEHVDHEQKPPEDENKIQEKEMEPINTNNQMEENTDKERKGWLKAQPEKLPSPTYWPFFLAMGLTFLFWGIITSWIILVVGLFIFITSLTGWINILRHEQ